MQSATLNVFMALFWASSLAFRMDHDKMMANSFNVGNDVIAKALNWLDSRWTDTLEQRIQDLTNFRRELDALRTNSTPYDIKQAKASVEALNAKLSDLDDSTELHVPNYVLSAQEQKQAGNTTFPLAVRVSVRAGQLHIELVAGDTCFKVDVNPNPGESFLLNRWLTSNSVIGRTKFCALSLSTTTGLLQQITDWGAGHGLRHRKLSDAATGTCQWPGGAFSNLIEGVKLSRPSLIKYGMPFYTKSAGMFPEHIVLAEGAARQAEIHKFCENSEKAMQFGKAPLTSLLNDYGKYSEAGLTLQHVMGRK
mmetsp:Transcript_119449/g.232461  ORF Transcript_119449/g.232461 Transcript_119449/m.232461 type:complete len:308 (+) Transcript_119449:67-990(+)